MSSTALRRAYGAASTLVLALILLPLVVIVWVSFFANRILAFPASG
jgi:putative spermidine/putrescine transport system permease protein